MPYMKCLLGDSKGQITIFFSTVVLILITFMAFLVNIGVFVKAKINLQNATDAAAFAGASVQARQLSNIAYMNWELRNVYKEWMFKYYILGGLGLQDVSNGPQGSLSNFRMQSYATSSTNVGRDSYNFPSVCIDFAGTDSVGLCTKYLVPGLPRFDPNNVIGIDETTNALVDALSAEKQKDCSSRSNINYATNVVWAYNVLNDDNSSIAAAAPEIGVERPGAFPKAFEIALRIRNLEAQVNTPPNTQGVCAIESEGVNCGSSIDTLQSNTGSPSQERIYKAFYSAIRNIGSETDIVMRRSYTLTEIPPTPFVDESDKALSTLLIPQDADFARNKFYLDLKLMTVNLATFYTSFVSNTQAGGFEVNGIVATSEGECASTKVGLPVPGYPMGYVKNPEVMTYYAVRGRAKFVGLFNPFLESFNITTYAAAKPFGGRIGPALFDVMRDQNRLFPRANPFLKSSGYISGLDTTQLKDKTGAPAPPNTYVIGAPIPINLDSNSANKFWINDPTGAVGGWITGNEIFFSVPNLIYDYPGSTATQDRSTYLSNQEIEQIIPNPEPSGADPRAGLYNPEILEKLRANLKNIGGTSSIQDIEEAVVLAKAPTLYDFANYMVPSPEEINNELEVDSFGVIPGNSTVLLNNDGAEYQVYDMNLYAPLFSDKPDSLYKDPNSLRPVLDAYIKNQEQSVKKYVSSMNLAAAEVYKMNVSQATGQRTGVAAAKILSDLDDATFSSGDNSLIMAGRPSCKSITGKFAAFYLNSDFASERSGPCQTPFVDSLIQFWTDNQTDLGEYYTSTYAISRDMKDKIFSAYRPGRNHDSNSNDGVVTNFLNKKKENMFRNYYSTKFVPLKSLTNSGFFMRTSGLAVFSEGSKEASADIRRTNAVNTLNNQSIGIDFNNVDF